MLNREDVLAYVLLTPTLLFLGAFVAYPFVFGVWLSLSNRVVGQPGAFVGIANFVENWDSAIYRQTVRNTIFYTAVATSLRFIFGMVLALLLNRDFRFKRFARAALLFPWIVPTALSTLAWTWIFDDRYGILNWLIVNWGIAKRGPLWLGDPTLAMVAVIAVTVWRGIPFFGITILAALQSVPDDLYDAAAVDGANHLRRFWHVTLPWIMPLVSVVLLLNVIWTFSEFQVVRVLTGGGPTNSTHLFSTLAYQVGMGAGRIGVGASIALSMFPVLAIVVVVVLIQLSRRK
jgi:multiple sugar transport system permease protein